MTALPLADFTDAEALALGLMEVKPDAPESLRERLALAIWGVNWRDEVTMLDWRASLDDDDREFYREQADAALDVLRGPSTCTTCGEAQAAIGRVTALADELEGLAERLRRGGERAATLRAAARIRAALAGPA